MEGCCDDCWATDYAVCALRDCACHCACPDVCDCQSPDTEPALVSNECPEHNMDPRPASGCPVHDPRPEGVHAVGCVCEECSAVFERDRAYDPRDFARAR